MVEAYIIKEQYYYYVLKEFQTINITHEQGNYMGSACGHLNYDSAGSEERGERFRF